MSHSGYRKIEKLGEGTYGTVYKALDKETGRIVALKRMVPMNDDEGIPATTIREIMLLKELRHPNIVRLYDVLFRIPKLTLVFEFCDCDLKQLMETRPNKMLNAQTEVVSFMFQMLNGLNYMHARSVVHRDIKPQNLLVNNNATELKVADLGLGRVEGIPVKKYTHDAVTLWYRSPDIIMGSVNYGLPCDMWSVGCVFAEMIAGQPLFCGRTDQDQILRMFRFFGTPTAHEWPSMHRYPNTKLMLERPGFEREFNSTFDNWIAEHNAVEKVGPEGIDLLKRMLQLEPSYRITAHDALKHVYFAQYHRRTSNSAASKVVRLPLLTPSATPEPSRTTSPLSHGDGATPTFNNSATSAVDFRRFSATSVDGVTTANNSVSGGVPMVDGASCIAGAMNSSTNSSYNVPMGVARQSSITPMKPPLPAQPRRLSGASTSNVSMNEYMGAQPQTAYLGQQLPQ